MIRKAITAVLLLFVAGSIVFLVASETRTATDVTAPVPATASTETSQRLGSSTVSPAPHSTSRGAETVVYYFHGTMRCPTCLKMEQFARQAVEEAFDAEINAGLIAWQASNYDEPANEHFLKEYGLTASAIVVVSRTHAGTATWRSLDRIWDLVGDEAAFKAYVVEAVSAMRRGGS